MVGVNKLNDFSERKSGGFILCVNKGWNAGGHRQSFFGGAGHSLLPRLYELVVLHGHLAAEGLPRVCGGAVGVDDGHPSWQEEDT